MKTYGLLDTPLSTHGFSFNLNGQIIRPPETVAEKVNETTKVRNFNAVGFCRG